jgi:long-chain acyl-CoA synthetase
MRALLVGDILEEAASRYADHTALVEGGRRFSYREAADRVRRLAGGLGDLGLQPGAHLGILANNGHRYWETYFAAHYAGTPLAPLNTRLSARELQFVAQDGELRALIVGPEYLELFESFQADLPDLKHVIVLGEDAPQGMHAYEDLLGAAPRAEAVRDWHEDDMINLCYTGGTTGLPKGVMLTHRNVVSNARHAVAAFGFREDDTWLHTAPMFHLADAGACYMLPMAGGSQTFLPSFAPEPFLDAVQAERVSSTILVPTMLNLVINHPRVRDYDHSSLRLILFGAAPMATNRILAARDIFGPILCQAYGMTEAAPLLTAQKLEWLDWESEAGIGRLASCGREVVGVQVRVVDEEERDVAPGGVGEVIARGPNIMKGYWKREKETEDVLRGDWYHTGDIARMDAQGYLYIVDRSKDMIISGGENIYSTETESALYEHPAVLEVAVIGIPDNTWGETVHAVVVLREGASAAAAELIEHCHERIAAYKCPKSVEFRSEPLPKSGANKILKTKLREPYWAGREKRVQ